MVVMAAVVSSRRKCRGELLARDSDMRVYCTKFFNTVSGSHHIFAACSSDLSRTTSPTSADASSPHSTQFHRSSAQAAPASLYTVPPMRRSKPVSHGPSAPPWRSSSTPVSTPPRASSRPCRMQATPCSTTRPFMPRCETARVAPALHRVSAPPSRTMTWEGCAPGSRGRVRYAQEVHERRVCRSQELV